MCWQLWVPIPAFEQFSSIISAPVQLTSSKIMGPVPWPYLGCSNHSAPVNYTIMQEKISKIHFNSCELYCATIGWEAKLRAGDHCLSAAPHVMTNSAPLIVDTNFHSSFSAGLTSYQPQLTICAVCRDWMRKFFINIWVKFFTVYTSQSSAATFTSNASILLAHAVVYPYWITFAW